MKTNNEIEIEIFLKVSNAIKYTIEELKDILTITFKDNLIYYYMNDYSFIVDITLKYEDDKLKILKFEDSNNLETATDFKTFDKYLKFLTN